MKVLNYNVFLFMNDLKGKTSDKPRYTFSIQQRHVSKKHVDSRKLVTITGATACCSQLHGHRRKSICREYVVVFAIMEIRRIA